MKRALSLIIVLAMVLCMIPFSAFAAPEWNVGGTDFVDGGNYALLEENGYEIKELLWKCEESGTIRGINFTPYVEEVAEGEEGEDYSEIPVFADVEGVDVTAEGFEGYPVVAGESYEISLYTNDQDWKGTAAINFVGELGSQTNPYVIALPEAAADMGIDVINQVPVPAGQTVFCTLLFFSGETVRVDGEGVKIAMGEDVFGSINGEDGNPVLVNTVDLEIAEGMRNVEIKLSNKTQEDQTYTFNRVVVEIPVGTEENPQEVVAGTYTAELKAGATPYFYKYIAEGNGTVKVSVNAADAEGNAIGWQYQVENKSVEVGGMGDTHWFDDEPVVNTETIAVTEGDEIVIWVNTYAPNDAQGNMQQTPAGNVTTTIEFVAEGSEEPAPTGLVLGDNTLTVANGATNEYTFTPDKNGTLTVAVTNLDPAAGNLGMIFGMGNMVLTVNGMQAMGPSIECDVIAGTPVTVSLANNMGQDETVTLNLAMAEPAAEIVLPWNETFEGEHDVYYTYTATEDCIIEFTSTGYLSIDGAEVKTYDESTKYVVLSAGDVISINPWAYETASYTAAIVNELPAANGSSEFPYVIDTVPYDASNSGETTLYYVYTATEDVVLNIIGDCYVDNGGWDDARDEDNNVVLYTGDEILISIYGGQAFVLDSVDPVATIGDAKYYSIDAAVAAAGNGDEIVLRADVEAEAGITLFAGVTLNLNGNVLTAPYIAALNGNFVVGAAGATINTTNMMAAELINIDGVDYEWVAGDGVYTLTPVVKPVANPVAKIGDTPYATVEDALNAAKSGETVTMIADDLNNADAILTIKGGVTLDLVAFDLKAAYVIGLADSVVTGSRLSSSKDYAKLYVDSNNISISNDTVYTQTASNGVDYHLITLKMGDYYVFTHTQLYDSEAEGDFGFTADKEAGTASITFYFNLPGVAKTPIAADGASAHGVSFIVEATWTAPTAYGDMYQSMTYSCSEELAKALASGSILACPIDNCNNYQDLKLTTKLVTDTGTVVVGETYTY